MKHVIKEDIPKQYCWLYFEGGPPILQEMLKLYGTQEFVGDLNNPIILKWAKEIRDYVGIEYKADSTPWCGLLCGICAFRAGYTPPFLCIRAMEWMKFGNPVKIPMLGDILVFQRKGGGHVGVYVGEDKLCYHVLGGNQSDMVNVTRINKDRLKGIRRPIWKVGQPDNVRVIIMDDKGDVSKNEV